MNRKQKRSIDKKLKTKMTDKQFTQFKQQAIDEVVEIQIQKFTEEFSKQFEECFIDALRENKIGKERAARIFAEGLKKMGIKTRQIRADRGKEE